MQSPAFVDLSSMMHKAQKIHMLGIGGSGMSGMAELLLASGHQVSGSDLQATQSTCRLKKLGARIDVGHSGRLFETASLVVISSAIAEDNPELQAIRTRGIPVVIRAEMLAELIRIKQSIVLVGAHGKTTTTALIAHLLTVAGLDPSWLVGGRVRATGGSARLGSGHSMVVEADESDASFLRLSPRMVVLTNIDREHMDAFGGDPKTLATSFLEFINRLPADGMAILCGDDPGIGSISPRIEAYHQSYGFDSNNDFYASDYSPSTTGSVFTLHRPTGDPLSLKLSLPGRHNVLNALAACAVAHHSGVKDDSLSSALASFDGVERRLEIHRKIRFHQRTVTLVNDYGHHPAELEAVINCLRETCPNRRLVMVFQPHRYTRTRDCREDFIRVLSRPNVLLLLEVYAAGEKPIAGASSQDLAAALRRAGSNPVLLKRPEDALKALASLVQEDDLVVIQGAGDIAVLADEIKRGNR